MKRYATILGLLVSLSLYADAATIYVSPQGGNEPPFSTVESAANDLQTAADIAQDGDEILVAPGVYTNGGSVVTGTLTNRLAVPQGVTVRGMKGASETVIRGVRGHSTNSVRCVYLRRRARLIGVTVEEGGTRGQLQGVYHSQSGGGIFCEGLAEVRDCIVVNCTAYNYGGGIFGGSVSNCAIVGNWALRGGGVAFAKLDGCLIIGNQVTHLAGGVYRSRLTRCTVENNVSGYGAGGAYETDAERSVIIDNLSTWIYPNYRWGTLNNCATDPVPERGVSNVTSRAEGERLGFGAPRAIYDTIPDTVRTNTPGMRRTRRTDKRKRAMGIEPVPGDVDGS